MSAIIAIALEFAKIAPTLLDAGISIWGLYKEIRAALDAHAAPDDEQWRKADAAVAALKARALDPSTDAR